ncbi:SOS response-associated peptidase [Georgenia ruanii]|uniref:SOS response-associated peptidase n=1 Tax=Georgenia ruanii TaxID=348442 RepID=UPI00221E4963|nr:SOS response-associated peptidase [Georgenia ruanii]
MAFGGLYGWWKDPELPDDHPEKWRWTNTVLTTTASDAWGTCTTDLRSSCRPDMLADWLNPGITDPKDVRGMVAAMPEPHLVPRPVGKTVGNVRNNGPQLVEPVEF